MKIKTNIPMFFVFIKNIIPKIESMSGIIFLQENAIVCNIEIFEIIAFRCFELHRFFTWYWVSVSKIQEYKVNEMHNCIDFHGFLPEFGEICIKICHILDNLTLQ